MLLNDEVNKLRKVPLFAGIAPAKLKLLAFISERVAFREGEVLFNQGDDGDAAYVILSGKANVFFDDDAGELQLAELNENAIVGEIAILCDGTRTATVRATTRLDALRIRKDNFLKLLADSPEVTLEVMRVLAARLNNTLVELSAERNKRERSAH